MCRYTSTASRSSAVRLGVRDSPASRDVFAVIRRNSFVRSLRSLTKEFRRITAKTSREAGCFSGKSTSIFLRSIRKKGKIGVYQRSGKSMAFSAHFFLKISKKEDFRSFAGVWLRKAFLATKTSKLLKNGAKSSFCLILDPLQILFLFWLQKQV